jgi:hypothetical protein
LLFEFLDDTSRKRQLNLNIKKTIRSLKLIVKRIKDKIATKDSKIEVLINYWDKMVGAIRTKATKFKDETGDALIQKIILVPNEVRRAVLKHYCDRARQLHNIAFMQWRMLYPHEDSRYHDPEELEDLITKRITMINNFVNPKMTISDITFEATLLYRQFLTRYQLEDRVLHSFNILSFT